MRLCVKDDCPVPSTFTCWACAKSLCLNHAFRLLNNVYCYSHFEEAVDELDFDTLDLTRLLRKG